MAFISWCNENEGFFSFLLSVIAIVVSIVAIMSQNNGVVFEKRLSLYCEVENVYKKSQRIIEICVDKSLAQQQRLIATVMFDFRSEEKRLVYKASEIKSGEETDALYKDVMTQYLEICLEKYYKDNTGSASHILYKPEIAKSVEDLFDHYNDMRLGLLVSTKDEIDEWIEKLNLILVDMDERQILKKMKKKLPL